MKTAPVAIGGTIAALVGTLTSYHWDMGMLGDLRKDFNHKLGSFRKNINLELGSLRKDNNLEFGSLRKDNNLEFGRLWVAIKQLLASHTEVRKNMQAINDTLTKTLKAQQDCTALQAARLELFSKERKGKVIKYFVYLAFGLRILTL